MSGKVADCLDCGDEIEVYGKKVRCSPCQKSYKRFWRRMYHRKDMYKRRIEKAKSRTGQDMQVLTENHMIGLGTINFAEFDGDFDKEFETLQKLGKGILRK